MDKQNVFYATGRRKSAIARAWLKPGNGLFVINDQPVEKYFKVESARVDLAKPFSITNTVGTFDVKIRVLGGGISGQAGAVRLGITRALMIANPELRQVLKKAGFVRRDPRAKERKKYGQRGARARYQFSKR
ncbi:MAG: 30S ribosomal protein S9 [Desulfobacteraceae bacterium]|nr:MAG: 30S ribosomal protein S9 [Desulfobacteraceae bacterium]